MATVVVQFSADHVQNRLTVRYCTVALNARMQVTLALLTSLNMCKLMMNIDREY
jgi:hypothetical protein